MEEIGKLQGYGSKGIVEQKISSPAEFKKVLENFLSEVNKLQTDAGKAIRDFIAGKEVDIHKVMIAAQEAHISFQLMVELKNRLISAYQEIMRMRI